jgi:hypothetical protein
MMNDEQRWFFGSAEAKRRSLSQEPVTPVTAGNPGKSIAAKSLMRHPVPRPRDRINAEEFFARDPLTGEDVARKALAAERWE